MKTKITCSAQEIIDLETGGLLGYYAHGHFTGEELLNAAKWYSGDEITFDTSKARHTHYRQIPITKGQDYDYGKVGDFRLVESKPGRGAYPVTVIEL